MDKRFWHELTQEEIDGIPKGTLCSELREQFAQPDWCKYQFAIGTLGCWSLMGDNRTEISREYCGKCPVFKGNPCQT